MNMNSAGIRILALSVHECMFEHGRACVYICACGRPYTRVNLSGGTRECAVYARMVWPLNLARKLELASAVRSRTCTPIGATREYTCSLCVLDLARA